MMESDVCSRTAGGGGYKIIGETNAGATALALMEREQPEVVLLDCRLPDLSGREIAALAQAHGYTSRLIAYSAREEYDDVMGMLEHGVVGYIVKDESPENLRQAIATVARGGTWFSQRIAKKLAEWAQAAPVQTRGLTNAEKIVLRYMAAGKSDREIAADLRITPRTVRFHRQNISDKLHLTRREQIMLWALEHGYGKQTASVTPGSNFAKQK
ncbi:MAG: response regulator transcription factor [Chloroflexi bacterium]|nr:response regulator transcription factor [Chloroflexota bacterium]